VPAFKTRGSHMADFTTRPEILGNFGVVASTHWLATAAGMAMLEKGGNAFDAAVAAGFALQVVEPHMNGPGGDAPILLWDSTRESVDVICGQGVAPELATIERYRDYGLDLVPAAGLLAAVVPGAFDAWLLLLRDYGTLRLHEVMEHAIGYAERGYPLVPQICATIASVQQLFEDEWVTSAETYLPDGDVPRPGSLFRNLDLVHCWRRIILEAESATANREGQIDAARRIWAEGFVAEAIDSYCRTTESMDSSGRRHGGLLRGGDMAKWRATVEKPLTFDYHGHTVCKCGPWSQGPVFLQQLALLSGYDIGAMDPLGEEFVHTVTECAKLAFADREAFYGDPNHVNVPLHMLLGAPYNDLRRKLVTAQASADLRPGELPGFGGSIRLALEQRAGLEGEYDTMGGGEPTRTEFADAPPRGDTCHIDVIDRHGNMVSATPSGGWLQSSPIIPSLGFCLGSRAQMFWLDPDSPSALAPGRRPRTTLTPSLALRDGRPYMAFGTPGGDQQDQWSVTFFLRHVHHRMNLQQAIDAPMFHTDHMPSSFWPRNRAPASLTIEGRFGTKTAKALRKRGHEVTVAGDWDLGRLSAATRDGGLLKVAANPRGMQGYAIGR
jgi:gamma-glutamyltranspeptidase/glutathione hydrolase